MRIELSVPGRMEIVVAHEPDHLQRRFQAPDLHNAINEAFRIAELRLSKYKGKITNHEAVQRHESARLVEFWIWHSFPQLAAQGVANAKSTSLAADASNLSADLVI